MKPAEHFERTLELEGRAILRCAEKLRTPPFRDAVTQAVELCRSVLEHGGKIVVTGVGKSGKVADKIASTLSSTGSLAIYLHPTEGLHGDLGVVTSKDLVLALSQTGNSEEIARLLPSLQERKVPLIAISGNVQGRLAQKANVWLDSSVEQEACPHNLAPTTSTTLALALGDALAVALMQARGFDAQAFARNHPGGALGRRLTLKVEDLMHTGDALAVVELKAPMDEVITKLTDKKLGAVIVTGPDQKLLGVVTDGDLRRALKFREKLFSMTAGEIMTRSPVTIDAEAMAQTALEAMENRPSQISVLPVVDSSGACWVGLIRLHDLVQSL